MCEDDSVRLAGNICNRILPLVLIGRQSLDRLACDGEMSPCVAGEFPAFILTGFRDFGRFGDLLIPVEIRVRFEICRLILPEIFPGLVRDVCPVTEDSVVTCHGSHSARAFVSAVRMFAHKCVQTREHIVIADSDVALLVGVLDFYEPVLVDYGFVTVALAVVGVIVTPVVDGEHERVLVRREK